MQVKLPARGSVVFSADMGRFMYGSLIYEFLGLFLISGIRVFFVCVNYDSDPFLPWRVEQFHLENPVCNRKLTPVVHVHVQTIVSGTAQRCGWCAPGTHRQRVECHSLHCQDGQSTTRHPLTFEWCRLNTVDPGLWSGEGTDPKICLGL